MRTVLVIVASLSVSACASSATQGGPGDQYAALSEACHDRGGVLAPSMERRLTGKAGNGYVCRISGGATRIPPPSTAG